MRLEQILRNIGHDKAAKIDGTSGELARACRWIRAAARKKSIVLGTYTCGDSLYVWQSGSVTFLKHLPSILRK